MLPLKSCDSRLVLRLLEANIVPYGFSYETKFPIFLDEVPFLIIADALEAVRARTAAASVYKLLIS